MLSRDLQQTLHRMCCLAEERHHEYATLDHLLLGLADDPDAIPVLRAGGVDLDRLRADLRDHLDSGRPELITGGRGSPKVTAGVQRVVQRAVVHVQVSGRKHDVTGADVLVALFSERESQAIEFLHGHDMTRLDAVNFLSTGIVKPAGEPIPDGRTDPWEQAARRGTFDPADPRLARTLEETLRRSTSLASERRHAWMTLEHLLLALTNDVHAATMLDACGVDLGALRTELVTFLDETLTGLVMDGAEDPKPTAAIQRVIQRATRSAPPTGSDAVTGANLLMALFSEPESHGVYFLRLQGITRRDAENFVDHGIGKKPGTDEHGL